MIHTIIYDNRQSAGGYNFYAHTPNFPEDALPEIRNVCQHVDSSGNIGRSCNLRYQPLKKRYLLSVIIRLSQGNDFSARSIHRIVNFLMDSDDASRLLDFPFMQTGPQLVQYAFDLLNYPYDSLPEGIPFLETMTPDPNYRPANSFSPATLLAAASYCQNASLRKQAYFGTNDEPLEEIDALMQFLPRKLRKGISFQTDILNVVESTGIALSFGKADTIAKMKMGEFMGGPPETDKYVYYPGEFHGGIYDPWEDNNTTKIFSHVWATLQKLPSKKLLLQCIETWEDFRHLGSLAGKNLHTDALQLIPQAVLLSAVNAAPPDHELFLALHNDCPKSYKQLRRYLHEKLTPAKPQPAPADNPHRAARPRTNKQAPTLSGASLMAYGSLLVSLLGGVLGLAVLWKLLKKLIDLQTVMGDAQLNITISLSDSIGLLRIVGSFLLGALLALVFSRLFKEIARLLRKK